MSSTPLLLGVCAIGALVFAIAQGPRYGVGRSASAEEIRDANVDVAPNGAGLPAGHGTALQGRAVYRAKCAGCHGERGQGGPVYPALVGGRGTLASDQPLPTVGSYWPYATTLWDYIHRAMPYQNPGSLTSTEVYSVTAYVLFMNRIVGEHEELNDRTLPEVRMPNRNGFVPDPRPDAR